MTEYSYILNGNNKITIILDSQIFNFSIDNDGLEKFDKVVELIKNKASYEDLLLEVSIKKQIEVFSNNFVKVENGNIFYKDKLITSTYVGTKILEMYNNGFDISPLTKFIDNLYQNTSYRSVSLLYGFLEKYNMPITPDGCFLAYKKIYANFKDIYTNTIDNSVGKIVEMDRNEIDDDPNSLCSKGLHFCSFDYLRTYSDNTDDIVVIVKINPKDVVSIPVDCSGAKGRCCKYEVVSVNKTVNDKNLTEPVMDFSKKHNMPYDYDPMYEHYEDEDYFCEDDEY